MTILDTFCRATKSRPCPVCGRADWCLVAREDQPSSAVCQRVESPCRWQDAGWFHRLRHDSTIRARAVRVITAAAPSADFAALASDYERAMTSTQLSRLANQLEVRKESLRRLRAGWSGRAWSFPMSDAAGSARGIRLRYPDGTKLSAKGGREGLFIPSRLAKDGTLLIAEGPTDTAALLDLGFDAVGRPNCSGGMRLTVDLVRAWRPESIVIAADPDEPGRRGASRLALALTVHCRDVRTIVPPDGLKDMREWARAGASQSDVQTLINTAPPLRLRVIAEGVSR